MNANAQVIVDVRSFGAVADNVTDNRSAFQSAINRARDTGGQVYIPAGRYAYSGLVFVRGVTVVGDGPTTVLRPLAKLTLRPDGGYDRPISWVLTEGPARLKRLKFNALETIRDQNIARGRSSNEHQVRIDAGASGYLIENIEIHGSIAGGIYNCDGFNGVIRYNFLKETSADSIHNTCGSTGVQIYGNRIRQSGDDGIAAVGYRNHGRFPKQIKAWQNDIRNNLHGRGLSVVGATDVKYYENFVDLGVDRACFMIAQEKNNQSYGSFAIEFRNNFLRNCGSIGDQGAFQIYGNVTTANEQISGVDIIDNCVSSSGPGFRINGDLAANDIRIYNNAIDGAPAYAINRTPTQFQFSTTTNLLNDTGKLVTALSCPDGSLFTGPRLQSNTPNRLTQYTLSTTLGGKVTLKYNWIATRLASNYRVFVHIINGNGDVLFNGDHEPPIPTTSWSGAISYAKELTLPSSLARGTYRVVVGLYNSSGNLVLAPGVGVTDIGSRRYQVGTLTVK